MGTKWEGTPLTGRPTAGLGGENPTAGRKWGSRQPAGAPGPGAQSHQDARAPAGIEPRRTRELVPSEGFGEPWIWCFSRTAPPAEALDRLRSYPPSSGLTLALDPHLLIRSRFLTNQPAMGQSSMQASTNTPQSIS